MIRKMNAAWLAAMGASVMLMGVQAHGIIQKPVTKPATPKPVTAKPAAAAQRTPTTTLTGCLRMDGDQFELTNLKGSEASKGRSWKTGFIMKTAKSVEVAPASASVRLKDHVGREVSVVGTRSDEGHLRANSIRRLATSCAS
jgi:hypothetical protein